jgi:hypothetical protein
MTTTPETTTTSHDQPHLTLAGMAQQAGYAYRLAKAGQVDETVQHLDAIGRLSAAYRNSLGVEHSMPRVVVICGSTRFMAEMTEADLRETAAGNIVVKPGCNMKQPHPLWADPLEAEHLKGRLDQLHRAKIRLADEVLVVGDYIGSSTTSEIRYARALGKPVRFTHPQVDPERAE